MARASEDRGASSPQLLHVSRVNSVVTLLDPSFNPMAPVGGVPFCSSASLGTILCYPPSYLKKAYDFPPTSGPGGLDGRGQTIVIVDAFGSPTIQSDLNTFDTTFGLPSTTVTILCGATWTGAATDNCPIDNVTALFTTPPAGSGPSCSWPARTGQPAKSGSDR